MGEIVMGIAIRNGKTSIKVQSMKATITDISMSISLLEVILRQQIKIFEKLSKFNRREHG